MKLDLLSSLWLHEPDEGTLARSCEELDLPKAKPAELAVAFTDLFLLNVYPYGTIFTEPLGELNGPAAHQVAKQFEAHGYAPPELNQAGAPDHLGLCLGFLAHMYIFRVKRHLSRVTFMSESSEFLYDLLSWAPVCCLAVEREPSAHPFYRALAARTREELLRMYSEKQEMKTSFSSPVFRESLSPRQEEEDIRLHDILQFLLAPARCGMFLSRSRLGEWGRVLGLPLPFSSRYDVAESLFAAAGQSGQVEALLDRLAQEAEAWERAYQTWAKADPTWAGFSAAWIERIQVALGLLNEMQGLLSQPLELEVHDV